ncbi:MAG: VOC family protein [Acidobacteriota bacterium]|nr:VOC family protein [Acidobacteriota bacterium]
MQNAINWFEIPAVDFNRAVTFYNAILDTELKQMDFQGMPHAMLPFNETEGVGGAIVSAPELRPSQEGVRVYLNGGDDLGAVLDRVAGAGGTVAQPKTLINEQIGYSGAFVDTEGNHVGLHSRQ